MSRWTHRKSKTCDRRLAPAFYRNAVSFHQGAEAGLECFSEMTRYFLAIATELALKAYLLDRGISDDWNRINIRHDLVKALKCARRAGLVRTPCGLDQLAALLSPYYQTHRIADMPGEVIGEVSWTAACEIVGGLIEAVQAGLGQGSSNSSISKFRSGRWHFCAATG